MSLAIRIAGFALAAAAVPLAAAVAQSSGIAVPARAAGQVGERFDGYLGFSTPPTATLRTQVDAINIRRRSLYSSLAVRRGVAPADVGIAAACELMRRVAVGEAYLLSDGVWRRRSAGQAAPKPDYCG